MRIFITLLAVLCCTSASAQDKVDNDLLMGYLQDQQYDQVIRYMEETVKPEHPNGLVILANAYYQNAQYPESAQYYKKILEIAPDHMTAHQQLGNLAVQQFKHDRAYPTFYASRN